MTGAASGIGRAVATQFAVEGAEIVVADSSVSGGLQTVEEIRAAAGKASFRELDVSRSAQITHVVQETIDRLGCIHVLFNGAGVLAYGTVLETAEDAWAKMMAVNLTGTYLCCRAVLPHMIKLGRGVIINVASTTGSHDACARAAAYVSSKGGVTLLTRAMAIDHAKQGIRVNALCPGPTDTPMLRTTMTPPELEAFGKTLPMGRLGQPKELAQAALFLASDDASFITGSLLYVDGGQTAQV